MAETGIRLEGELSERPEMEKTEGVRNILIVDDEFEFVSSVRRHLKRRGLKPDFALNGEIACCKMLAQGQKRCAYDLVITDVVMPIMDGISLLKWIQAIFPETSVMVVSEFADFMHLENNIRPELDDIGRKPMTPESMMKLIGSISKKRVLWQKSGAMTGKQS